MKNFKKAFTLAEVLITLGIIGVVAALTIPTLVKNNQKTQTVSQLKKVYNEITTAFNPAMLDYNRLLPFDSDATVNQQFVHDEIMSNIKYSSYCPMAANTVAACPNAFPTNFAMTNYAKNWTEVHPLALNSGYSKYFLPDGVGIAFSPSWWPGSVKVNANSDFTGWGDGYRSNIYVDINGIAKPNATGVDIFALGFGNLGINFYVTNGTGCNTTGQGECFKKIVLDGWQIKDDYPW